MNILVLLLLVVLVLAVVGLLPQWRPSSNYGYGPSGIGGLLLVLLIIWLLMGGSRHLHF